MSTRLLSGNPNVDFVRSAPSPSPATPQLSGHHRHLVGSTNSLISTRNLIPAQLNLFNFQNKHFQSNQNFFESGSSSLLLTHVGCQQLQNLQPSGGNQIYQHTFSTHNLAQFPSPLPFPLCHLILDPQQKKTQ